MNSVALKKFLLRLTRYVMAVSISILALVPLTEVIYFAEFTNRLMVFLFPFLVYFLYSHSRRMIAAISATPKDGIGILAIACICSLLYAQPFPVIVGGQDPSVYFAKAMTAIDFDELDRPMSSWSKAYGEPELLETVLDVDGAYNTLFNGINPKVDPNFSKLETDFTAAPIATHTLLGAIKRSWVFYGSLLFSSTALFAFYFLLRTRFEWHQSLGGTLVLAFNTTQYWFGNATYSEVPAQAVSSLCFILLLLSNATNARYIFFAILSAIASISLRSENFLLVTLLLLAVPFLSLPIPQKVAITVTTAAAYLLYDHLIETNYSFYYLRLEAVSSVIDSRHLIVVLSACIATLASSIKLPRLLHVRGWASRVPTFAYILIGGSLFVFLLFVRPALEPFHETFMHGRTMRTFRENTLYNISLTISPIILLFSFIGFFISLKHALNPNADRMFSIYAAVGAVFFMIYIFDPLNSPQMFWVLRRFIPLVLPFLIFYFIHFIRVIRSTTMQYSIFGLCFLAQLHLFTTTKPTPEMAGALESVNRFLDQYPKTKVILAPLDFRHELFAIAFYGNIDVIPIADTSDWQSIVNLSAYFADQTVAYIERDPNEPDFVFSYIRRGENYFELPKETYLKSIPMKVTEL